MTFRYLEHLVYGAEEVTVTQVSHLRYDGQQSFFHVVRDTLLFFYKLSVDTQRSLIIPAEQQLYCFNIFPNVHLFDFSWSHSFLLHFFFFFTLWNWCRNDFACVYVHEDKLETVFTYVLLCIIIWRYLTVTAWC